MDTEERIQRAITALQSGVETSVRKAATNFDVPRSTLRHRMAGMQPNKSSKIAMQRLTPEEEDAIKKTILQLFAWGWPMTIKAVEALASQLLVKRGDTQPLGKNWHYSFLARHPDLKTLWSRSMDQGRKDATNHETARKWFDLFLTVRLLYDICDDDTYNMDEKGCMKGIGQNTKVFVPRREAEVFSTQPGNREWVSIIECVGATGEILPPFIIFEGQRIQADWIDKSIDSRTVIQVSPNGWTDSSIALTWIQHFDHYTAGQTRGIYRLLILDGHASHTSPEFVQYCQDHKIVPLCLPPHSTHYLQPLDVGIFGPLATAYKTLVSQGSVFGAQRINNRQFLQYYQQARQTIGSNIPGAWRGTGLVPWNPDKILLPLRPTTTPSIMLTDQYGRSLNATIDGNLAYRVNQVISDALDRCATTPQKRDLLSVKEAALTALADRATLQVVNQSLIEKTSMWRKKSTAKHFGEARVLTVDECHQRTQEREAKEFIALQAKARRLALKGKVGFVKLVWKEFPTAVDLFD